MARIGIHRSDEEAAYSMAAGFCPVCDGAGLLDDFSFSHCNVCGGTGRILPYRVWEGVRCVVCEYFRRCSTPPLPKRMCALTGSPLWSPWIWHSCPGWKINLFDVDATPETELTPQAPESNDEQ